MMNPVRLKAGVRNSMTIRCRSERIDNANSHGLVDVPIVKLSDVDIFVVAVRKIYNADWLND